MPATGRPGPSWTVDSARQCLGHFAVLRNVRPGERIEVRGSDGLVGGYRVTGRRSHAKAQGLPADVFDQSVAPRLALITCTGHFDRSRRSYDDLVAYAVPDGPPLRAYRTAGESPTPGEAHRSPAAELVVAGERTGCRPICSFCVSVGLERPRVWVPHPGHARDMGGRPQGGP